MVHEVSRLRPGKVLVAVHQFDNDIYIYISAEENFLKGVLLRFMIQVS